MAYFVHEASTAPTGCVWVYARPGVRYSLLPFFSASGLHELPPPGPCGEEADGARSPAERDDFFLRPEPDRALSGGPAQARPQAARAQALPGESLRELRLLACLVPVRSKLYSFSFGARLRESRVQSWCWAPSRFVTVFVLSPFWCVRFFDG